MNRPSGDGLWLVLPLAIAFGLLLNAVAHQEPVAPNPPRIAITVSSTPTASTARTTTTVAGTIECLNAAGMPVHTDRATATRRSLLCPQVTP